jgi:hypothetical protein
VDRLFAYGISRAAYAACQKRKSERRPDLPPGVVKGAPKHQQAQGRHGPNDDVVVQFVDNDGGGCWG